MSARVWNLHYQDAPPGAVYVGRWNDGLHGNPLVFGQRCRVCGRVHIDVGSGRADLLSCYEEDLRHRLATDFSYLIAFATLQGKELVCHCAPRGGLSLEDPCICHGQVQLKLLAELQDRRTS